MALYPCKHCGHQVASQATTCPSCGGVLKRKISGCAMLALLALFAVLLGIGWILIFPDEPQTPAQLAAPEESLERGEQELAAIEVTAKWEKPLSTVGIFDLTITNGNDFPVKDVRVNFHYRSESGAPLGSDAHTLHRVVPANGSVTIEDYNGGFIHQQSNTVVFSVLDFSR